MFFELITTVGSAGGSLKCPGLPLHSCSDLYLKVSIFRLFEFCKVVVLFVSKETGDL